MANVRNGNTYYIDTQYSSSEELAVKGLRVTDIIVTTTGTTASVILQDSSTANIKFRADEATSGVTTHFPLKSPIVFPNGIRPSTLTNCVVTVVFERL